MHTRGNVAPPFFTMRLAIYLWLSMSIKQGAIWSPVKMVRWNLLACVPVLAHGRAQADYLSVVLPPGQFSKLSILVGFLVLYLAGLLGRPFSVRVFVFSWLAGTFLFSFSLILSYAILSLHNILFPLRCYRLGGRTSTSSSSSRNRASHKLLIQRIDG